MLHDMEEALTLGGSDLDAMVERAVRSGALRRDHRGFFRPAALPAGRISPQSTALWAAFAPQGFFVKPFEVPPESRVALRAIFEALRKLRCRRLPPVWLSESYVISHYMADGMDLRYAGVTLGPTGAAQKIYRLCVDALLHIVELDSLLRNVLREARTRPKPFDIIGRYDKARNEMAATFGPGLVEALPDLEHALISAGPQVLFSDPKPANLLVPKTFTTLNDPLTLPWIRIDLDMMFLESPLLLQYVLIYFAHPVKLPEVRPFDVAFMEHFDVMLQQTGAVGTGRRKQAELMVWYHLLRNFTAAYRQGQTDKAGSMGRMLTAASRCFPALGLRGAGVAALSDGLKPVLQER